MATARRSDDALLGRLDERTHQLGNALKELQLSHKEGIEKVLTAIQTHSLDDSSRFDKVDSRLKTQENWRWYVLGATCVLIAIASWLLK